MLTFCLLTAFLGTSLANNTYVFVAPDTVRPGMEFDVSGHILRASSDVRVEVSLMNETQSIASTIGVLQKGDVKRLTIYGAIFQPKRNVICKRNIRTKDETGVIESELKQKILILDDFYVKRYDTGVLVFPRVPHGDRKKEVPKDLPQRNYTLKISGSSGLTFTTEKTLSFQSKSMSIFVQTDKVMYKPSQTVHFRVFAIYPDMKMYTGKMNMEIFDPNSNKIKQWIGVHDKIGVITNYLPLASQPMKGDWKIKVTAGGSSTEKVFTVSRYVLPKFEVTVELPSYALSSDRDITATVKAKYTYGKPVNGTLDLSLATDKTPQGKLQALTQMFRQTAKIDGEAQINISLAEMRRVFNHNLNNRNFHVIANVTESLTGIKQNGSSEVKIYRYATKLSFAPTDPKTFKPGLKYIAYLQVQQHDGRPAPLSSHQVVISTKVSVPVPFNPRNYWGATYYYNRTTSFIQPDRSFSVPSTGVVVIELDTPINASKITLKAKYGPITILKSIEKSNSPSNNYIQLLLSSSHLSIMSRGSIVATGIKNASGQTAFNLTVSLTSEMAPTARIIVYYVRTDGEIVADSISFNVEGLFENKVSIAIDKTSAQPGDSVNVKVTADPQSLVNLLAVDQSVLLLKSGNDITQGQVIDEIKTYGNNKALSSRGSERWGWGWGWEKTIYTSGLDANQIFQNADVLVMTDALVYRYYKIIYRWHSSFIGAWGFTSLKVPAYMGTGTGTTIGTGGYGLKEVENIRQLFPELWLWTNTTTSVNGSATISTVVPDTITSWVASAFAVNSATGLGVAPTTAKITVFRPFFVSLNLPYSVTRGEQLALQSIVFNYLTQDVDVVVSLPQSNDYMNIIIDANGNERQDTIDQIQTVHVKAGQAKSVFFPIMPATLGKIDITVSARSTLAADAVKRLLLVEAEGSPKEYNVPILIDLKQNQSFTKSVPLTLPQAVVSGSQQARVTAIGDMMGPSISGLDHLLRMPTGCGEQTMLGLAPDVFVTNYLKATNQLTGDVAEKAFKYMESGYQRELTYQHKNGSFSAFGDRDQSGNMWLTAFVVKTFHQAKSHIFIDETVIVRAIDWMLRHQAATGEFPELGRLNNKNMAGGSAKGTSLTAFVLIALLENNDLGGGIQQRIKGAVTSALQFLEGQTPTDDYALTITTYALTLAKSQRADTLFATLNSHAVVKNGFKYWHRPATKTTPSRSYWRPPNSKKAIDVEMTSYALLVYLEKKYIRGGISIMKWIASQRNPQGGFCSTQDTIVALQTLSEFARIAYSGNFNLQVKVTAATFTHNFSVNQRNALVLQSTQLPSIPSSITVEAKGNGLALIQIGVFFNVEMDVEEPTFEITTKILNEDINSITLQTCARWRDSGTSGMAIEEIGIPSGFEAATEGITKLGTLKRIETENKKVILYFDEIGLKPVCVKVDMVRTGMVAKTKPVPVRVYDYYEPTNQVTAFYTSKLLSNSTICSVCVKCNICDAPVFIPIG